MRKWLRHSLLFAAFSLWVSNAAAEAAPAELIKTDILKLPELSATSTAFGGRLLLSDSPETPTEDGILYQDMVSGDVRLFLYHVNGTAVNKRFVVILENTEPEPAQVTVYQYGIGGPGFDYHAVGKAAQVNYLKGNNIYLVEVPGNGKSHLSSELTDTVVKPNALVNGIYDFKTDRPVTVKVMMLPVHADSKKFADQAQILPADEQHLRGTFEGRDRMIIPNKVYNPGEDGPMVITLADNYTDLYMRGIDATDGTPVVNYGNYGVFYKLFLPSEAKGKVNYWLNPRGGEYAGWLGIKYQHQQADPAPTPKDTIAFGHNKLTDFAHIGTFEAGQSLWLTFSPPGASNLPVKLVIMPESFK
jgi:hypothetical protein